jgi:hypothetical protein
MTIAFYHHSASIQTLKLRRKPRNMMKGKILTLQFLCSEKGQFFG